MLVLLSFALVLVATVLLVLGLLSGDGLTLIYLSIASSVGAAIVLLAALRVNKTQAAGAPRASSGAIPDPELELVMAGSDAGAASVAAGGATDGEWLAADQDPDDSDDAAADDEVDFPIADYDSLSVGQILPLLPQLYSDEIDVVEERERATKARPQVLATLAELRDATTAADPLATYTESSPDGWDDEDWFPIEDYESLSAAQILPLLPELDDEELALVRTRELSLGRRRSLLDAIDRKLGVVAAPRAAKRSAPAKQSAPAKKAPPVKKVAAVKKAATKVASTTKAAPAKKPAAAKKATPAKRATPTQKAVPAKRAMPAKKAAPAKRATPAKKAAPAKRATPAKKTSR